MVTPEVHVRIALSGDLSRLAEVLARSGVWAITREAKHGDSYRVTHVPSGRCLTMRWESLDKALEALHVLGARAPEWERDIDFGGRPESLPACVRDLKAEG